jgi:endogenous inhibitor of DNA gyrase (YacG/DUF329 family)
MALDYRPKGNGMQLAILVECPVCGLDLRDRKPHHHLLEYHGPEDFGLAPIGDRSAPGGCSYCSICRAYRDLADDTCPICGAPIEDDGDELDAAASTADPEQPKIERGGEA